MESLFTRPGAAPEALRAAVALNAGAAIYVGGIAPDLASGVESAMDALLAGGALARLEALRAAAPR